MALLECYGKLSGYIVMPGVVSLELLIDYADTLPFLVLFLFDYQLTAFLEECTSFK